MTLPLLLLFWTCCRKTVEAAALKEARDKKAQDVIHFARLRKELHDSMPKAPVRKHGLLPCAQSKPWLCLPPEPTECLFESPLA
jgi:hypothetical protein